MSHYKGKDGRKGKITESMTSPISMKLSIDFLQMISKNSYKQYFKLCKLTVALTRVHFHGVIFIVLQDCQDCLQPHYDVLDLFSYMRSMAARRSSAWATDYGYFVLLVIITC